MHFATSLLTSCCFLKVSTEPSSVPGRICCTCRVHRTYERGRTYLRCNQGEQLTCHRTKTVWIRHCRPLGPRKARTADQSDNRRFGQQCPARNLDNDMEPAERIRNATFYPYYLIYLYLDRSLWLSGKLGSQRSGFCVYSWLRAQSVVLSKATCLQLKTQIVIETSTTKALVFRQELGNLEK